MALGRATAIKTNKQLFMYIPKSIVQTEKIEKGDLLDIQIINTGLKNQRKTGNNYNKEKNEVK